MPAFPEFVLNKDLQPCVLTRELLQQIERQFLAAEADVFSEGVPVGERRCEVSVVDSFGVETFGSASDIPTTGFPESTQAVRIVLESASGVGGAQRVLKCKAAFRGSLGNQLTFRVRSPQARERAIGLCERIRQLVDAKLLDSWLFRRREWINVILVLVVGFLGLFWVLETCALFFSPVEGVDKSEYALRSIVLGTSSAYLAIVHFFFPRCAFESSRWSRMEQWRTWVAQGFLGLVVFDVGVFALGERIAAALGY